MSLLLQNTPAAIEFLINYFFPASVQAALTKHHKLGSLQTTGIYFLRLRSLRWRLETDLVFSEGLLSDL
jgi:hypothetical protein